MHARDPAVPVDHDVGTELERVIAARPPDGLAGSERPQGHLHDAGPQEPVRGGPPRAEGAVQRPFRVGDDYRPLQGELITPGGGAGTALRGDDNEPGAGVLDLGNGLRDTAEVGAADVSAGVPRKVHDGRVSEQIVFGDDLPVGVLELKGRE